MLRCSICNDWYPHVGSDRLDICAECLTLNFPATQDLDRTPPASDVSAYVCASRPSPRQVQAMARLAEHWRRQEEDAP